MNVTGHSFKNISHKRTHTVEKSNFYVLCARHVLLKEARETTHSYESSFACEKSDKTFTKKCILKIHNYKNSYECSVCGKCFVYTNGLKMHHSVHSRKKKKEIKLQCM